jgi:dCTP deaminase
VILSDRSIREAIKGGRILIDPFDPDCVESSSYDVHTSNQFRVFDRNRYPFIDPTKDQPELTRMVEVGMDEEFMLHPNEFVLGSTLERVRLPANLVARLEGKSSLGRLGLLIHSTAGYVDPGWDGRLTLELSNVSGLPIAIRPGMKIGQMSFAGMTTPADVPYGAKGSRSKYQGQEGPTASRFHEEFPQPLQSVPQWDGLGPPSFP